MEGMYPNLLAPLGSGATPKHGRGTDGSPPAGNFGFSPSKRQTQDASPKSSVGFHIPIKGAPAPDDIQEDDDIDAGTCSVQLDVDVQDPEAENEAHGLHQDLLGVCMANAGVVERVLLPAANIGGATDADAENTVIGNWFDDDDSGDECVGFADGMNFKLNDDSEDEGDNIDLEDAYNFDHSILADLVREGADRETLIQAAQEGMSEAFVDRMQDVGYFEVEGDLSGDGGVTSAQPTATEVNLGVEVLHVAEQAAAATESAESGPSAAKSCQSRSTPGARLFGHAPGTGRGGKWQTPPLSEDEDRPDMGSMSANMTPEIANTPGNAATPLQAGTPGNMTPPPLSPPTDAQAAIGAASPQKAAAVVSSGVAAEALAERLREVPSRQSMGRRLTSRRSSIRRDSIQDAMVTQKQMARKSVSNQMKTVLANLAAESEGSDVQVAPEVVAEAKQYIRTQQAGMDKAGDILEDADIDENDTAEAAKKLLDIQDVLAEASLRHRKAIELAVKDTISSEAAPCTMENIPEEASDEETQAVDQVEATAGPVPVTTNTAAAVASSNLKASAQEFKPAATLSATAKEWKPVDANSSLQEKMQDAIRQAYMRKISSTPVPASAVSQQPRGQGPVWTPGTATAEVSLQERMQKAAKEAQARRAGEGADVQDRIANARNAAAASRAQAMGDSMGSPHHGDTCFTDFGQAAGWDCSAAGDGQPAQQWDAASAYDTGAHQASYGADVQHAGFPAGAVQAAAGWTGQHSSSDGQWAAGWDQQSGAASQWNAAASWAGTDAANPWNAEGGTWAGY